MKEKIKKFFFPRPVQELRKKLWYRLLESIVITGYIILVIIFIVIIGFGTFKLFFWDYTLNELAIDIFFVLLYISITTLIIVVVRAIILYIVYGSENNREE